MLVGTHARQTVFNILGMVTLREIYHTWLKMKNNNNFWLKTQQHSASVDIKLHGFQMYLKHISCLKCGKYIIYYDYSIRGSTMFRSGISWIKNAKMGLFCSGSLLIHDIPQQIHCWILFNKDQTKLLHFMKWFPNKAKRSVGYHGLTTLCVCT